MTTEGGTARLARLAAEFGVIVVGVFVAVAAESWWSDREERQFERELREDMATEFAENIVILEQDLAINAEAQAHMMALAMMDDAALLAMSDDVLSVQYGVFPSWAGFDPAMGAVQALVGSGNLGVISDRNLRLKLSHWSGLLDEKQRYTLQTTNYQLTTLVGAISEVVADGAWSPEERRRMRSLYRSLGVLHGFVIANQRRLIEEARAIHDYLRETV